MIVRRVRVSNLIGAFTVTFIADRVNTAGNVQPVVHVGSLFQYKNKTFLKTALYNNTIPSFFFLS